MNIQKMRCYFLYNTPVTEQLLANEGNQGIGVTPQIIAKFKQRFQVQPATVPAFYTNHYRSEHTPYYIADVNVPHQTLIPKGKIENIDFFRGLNLSQDVRVNWDFMLSLQTTGLITIYLEIEENVPNRLAYRLGGLHLNPDYAVIATEPIKHLWSGRPGERPEFITLDRMAQVIREHFFSACGLQVRRVLALRHEIQIPFTTIEVETEYQSQREFVEKEARSLAEFVFKPGCWEVEHASMTHAQHILNESRVWSVAQDTYVVVAYEGALYVKIKSFDTGVPHEVSGFKLADESSVLHSFKLAVSIYHLLRILDDLLDPEITRLKREVDQHQQVLHASFSDPQRTDHMVLREMNEFVIQVTNLQFQLVELLEEIDNSDKLIDEEWHIVLLDKLNETLGTKVWRDSVNGRVNNLRELVQTVENTYQRFLNLNANKSIADFNAKLLDMTIESQKVEGRLKWVSYIFSVLAAAELIGLLIDVGLNDANALPMRIANRLGMGIGGGHGVAVVLVILILILAFTSIIWWENRQS